VYRSFDDCGDLVFVCFGFGKRGRLRHAHHGLDIRGALHLA
jgi:hypothetical protein